MPITSEKLEFLRKKFSIRLAHSISKIKNSPVKNPRTIPILRKINNCNCSIPYNPERDYFQE